MRLASSILEERKSDLVFLNHCSSVFAREHSPHGEIFKPVFWSEKSLLFERFSIKSSSKTRLMFVSGASTLISDTKIRT